MKILYLDIDGVLNDHTRNNAGVCGIKYQCALEFNKFLDRNPDVQIVVHSAWRYYISRGDMTPMGFNMMLQTHGLKVYQRIEGITRNDDIPDPVGIHLSEVDKYWWDKGLAERERQILEDVSVRKPTKWAVLDDLPLQIPNLVRTDRNKGLTEYDMRHLQVYFND